MPSKISESHCSRWRITMPEGSWWLVSQICWNTKTGTKRNICTRPPTVWARMWVRL